MKYILVLGVLLNVQVLHQFLVLDQRDPAVDHPSLNLDGAKRRVVVPKNGAGGGGVSGRAKC